MYIAFYQYQNNGMLQLRYILTNITYEILFQHFIYRIQIFIFAVSSGNGELENFFGCASKYLIFLIYYCLHCVAIHIDCAETVPIIVVIMDIDIYNPKYLTEYHSDNPISISLSHIRKKYWILQAMYNRILYMTT